MKKAFKFRIYPSGEQREMFSKTFGCCRFIYNKMLEDKIAYYKKTGKTLHNTPAQYKAEYEWLKEIDSLALCNVQLHLQAAMKNFFRNTSFGFPKFKSKHRSAHAYTTNNQAGTIRVEGGCIRIPKVGLVRVKLHRQIPEDHIIKSVTVSQSPSGKYYVSILCEFEHEATPVVPAEDKFVGLDFSMSELYVDSEGTAPQYPRYYRQAEGRLAKEQRKLAHMKKGSGNYQKQKLKIATLHEHIANQRKDFLHKLSRQIANDWDCVCIETLNMKAMAQALNFGKSVADNGWGTFCIFLQYKLEDAGKRLVKVNKFYPSSQTCHCCGHRNAATKDLSVRMWVCPECGVRLDRDVNAAINIRDEGKRMVLGAAA